MTAPDVFDRNLPVGWAETTIGAVTEPYESIDPTAEPSKEFRYIDIGSIDNSRQIITEPKVFSGREAPSRARRVVAAGDVLFSTVRPYLKNIAIVPPSLDGALTSTGIAVLRPSGAIESRYLFRWVCHEDFVAAMSQAQDGTMYPAVRDRDVAAGPILLPPLAEQRRIVSKLDRVMARTTHARNDLDRIPILIGHYKQALLAAACSGELTRSWRKAERLPVPRKVLLGELATDFSYGSAEKSQSSGEVPVLRMGNIATRSLRRQRTGFTTAWSRSFGRACWR